MGVWGGAAVKYLEDPSQEAAVQAETLAAHNLTCTGEGDSLSCRAGRTATRIRETGNQ